MGSQRVGHDWVTFTFTVYGRAHRKTVYLTQKQGRDTHSERNGMGILSIEEERSKSDPRRRSHPESSVALWARRSAVWRWCKSLTQASPSGSLFTFGQLSCFFFYPDGPWTLAKKHEQLFSKMDPIIQTCGCMSTFTMGWGPLPFRPSRSLPAYVQTGQSSLTSIDVSI